ncbi:MAG: polysaccharide deacetylase family protein [Chloroflexi bacterium]|nr:polysaccharide deacetylase family protein [Chloroflexota bacterium]
MTLRRWFDLRGPRYIVLRGANLVERYGLTPSKAVRRIDHCMATLADFGCQPTFPTPARVVEQYPVFFRHLQDEGAEIAVHGYNHVDLKLYRPHDACKQLTDAADVFRRNGIHARGFRCPYLGCSDTLLDALPKGVFGYSSNKAIWWDAAAPIRHNHSSTVVDTIHRFYQPASSQEIACVPWMRSGIVEIPVSVPDDLQLHDGFCLDSEGIAQAWSQILHLTHQRGELFVLAFHPELATNLEPAFVALLREASRLHPPVWISRLCDISDWWEEKSKFRADLRNTATGPQISFRCSARATVLARSLSIDGGEERWDGAYSRVRAETLDVPSGPYPLVGLPVHAPDRVVSFLREQGYVTITADTATGCHTVLDDSTLANLSTERRLIDHIEAATGPLVRYWRWPNGARSALCVTGDLDALTLLDYASRLFVH